MCCCKINTDILMANFFSKLDSNKPVTLDDLKSYLEFMQERFFTYIASDFCSERVKSCAERYPELYEIKVSKNGIAIKSGRLRPNLKYFNSVYNTEVASYIERLTDNFFNINRI